MKIFIKFQERIESRPIFGRYKLGSFVWKAAILKGLRYEFRKSHVRVKGFAAASQDTGVAGFEAKDGAIDGDVWARFVDDSNDADGYAYFFDEEALGVTMAFERFAERV